MTRRPYLILSFAFVMWCLATFNLIDTVSEPLVTVQFASVTGFLWLLTGIIIIFSWLRVISRNPTKELLQDSIQLIDRPILITDMNGKLVWQNESAKTLLNESEELSKQLQQLFDTISAESNQLIRQVVSTYDERYRVQIQSIERTRFLISLEPVNEVSGKNEFYDLFIRRIVHDMRNPLAAIIGHASNLRYANPSTPDEWRKSANTIETEAQRLSRLVDSMLFDARLSYVPLQLDVIDAADVIEESLYTVEESAVAQGKILQVHLPQQDIPLYVDRDLIVRAIENLIDNSIKYTGDSGKISIRLQLQEEQVRIQIQDNGVGIPSDYLPDKIFEPLVRATSQKGGSGLGLSTVKKIIEMHHGRIDVESKVEQGTLMTVILPLHKEKSYAS